ncbi:MAG: DUF4440 domain-containing protein [Bacteroidota bacterium]
MKYLFLFFLLPQIILFGQQQPDLQYILDQHAIVMGGKEKWQNFNSHITTYEVESKWQKFGSTLTMKMPNKVRIDMVKKDTLTVESHDGKEGWITIMGRLIPASDREDILMTGEPEFHGALVLAQERSDLLVLEGKDKINGKSVFKIKMKKAGTNEKFYYINTETYLLEMIGEYSEALGWKGTFFKTVFDDYRMVDGLLFPFELKLYSNDNLLRNYHSTEIKVNTPVHENIFNKDFNIIKRNARLFSKALMESDYDTVVDFYTDDGKIFPNGQKILSGHEALRNYWTPPPGSNNRITYHKVTAEEVEILGDTANDFGYYEGRSIGNDGQESSWKGKYIIVWKEVEPDVWKMYLDIWNSVRE